MLPYSIVDKTCVASSKEDQLKTSKQYLYHAVLKQGLTRKTKITAFSDGAKNCWSVIDSLNTHCDHVTKILDWFHLWKKFKNAEQALSDEYTERLTHIKWCVWHNKPDEALKRLKQIYQERHDEKQRLSIQGLLTYIKRNRPYLVNYEKRHKKGLPISSQVAESIIGSLINERYKKSQKMQWTREGAHNLLQIRTAKMSGEFDRAWPIAVNRFLQNVING